MKKTFQATFLVPSLLIIFSCQKKENFKSITWQSGQDKAALESSKTALSTLEFNNSQEVHFGKYKISKSTQALKGIEVRGTYLRLVESGENGETFNLQAKIIDEAQIKKINFAPESFESMLNFTNLLKGKIPSLAHVEMDRVTPFVSLHGSTSEELWLVAYTDQMGKAWELTVNPHFQIQTLRQVGSQFHEAWALVYPKGPKFSILTDVLLKQVAAVPQIANALVKVFSESTKTIDTVDIPLRFETSDPRFEQVQAFYFVNETLGWYESKWKTHLPYILEVKTHVGFPDKTNTAFYYGGKIRLGSGDDIAYRNIPQDPSIVYHETAHALIDAICGLPFQGEGGSINEALADTLAALQLDNPNMGEVAFINGPFKRTLNQETKYNDRNGGLYHDSLVLSSLLWQIRKETSTNFMIGYLPDLMARIHMQSNFDDVKKALVETAETMTEENKLIVQEILRKRGWL